MGPLSPTRSVRFLLLPLAALLAGRAGAAGPEPLPAVVEYNRDVRPILSDACYQCHGPDAGRRKAGLRLDTEAGARAELDDGKRALVPGEPTRSELIRRITSADPGGRMPPAKSGRRLGDRQVAILRRWVEQGARWQKHWSLLPPRRPDLPPVRDPAWVKNGIDAFVLARLEREGLRPSPEADRATLLRRVTLDLTGLPPTPEEADAFLADGSPGAYEKVVDRLLASPRYGERMAARWLDAARYADTNGYQSDGERFMWRWRDWVIDACNANKPFDAFTVEQLAGDLLPRPTLAQRIATGFNRNHRGNGEGGIIPEEYAVEYVVDRVDTTATVWLGLTVGCARCHDHKFDPITQKEFYSVFAYFNNVPERGKAVKYGNSPPVLKAPTPEQERRLADLDTRLHDAQAAFARLAPTLDAAQRAWEKAHPSLPPTPWSPAHGLAAHFPLDGRTPPPGAFRDGPAVWVPGRKGQAADFDGRRFLDAGDVGNFGFYDKFSLAAWIYPRGPEGGVVLSRMVDEPQGEGYSLHLVNGRLQVNLVKRWLDDALRVETERALPAGAWQHILVSYDGSRVAAGVKVYVNARPEKLRVLLDDLNQSFQTKEPFRVGGGAGPGGRFRGAAQDVRVWKEVVSPESAEIIAVPEGIDEVLALRPEQRTAAQAAKLRAWFLESHAPEAVRRAAREVGELGRERERFYEAIPTTMVMEETARPRDAFVLKRGEYDKRGVRVAPGVPAALGALPAGVPNNRLGFARWLVSPDNPLTARVAVNCSWQMFFGTGLVKTVEDFGSQGEWPSHPELLDWLATEFVRSGWDVKGLQRLIVTSATYRQSSKATAELRQRDPENRLLARGPRVRLPAETIRDQALFAAGLLAERLGGPSVKPYQPAGLWNELADTEYVPDHGEGLYRRSLYTFWKRTVAPPAMVTFDAPLRETCVVRETRTNTPLQALTLMNDVTFVEAARCLAQRVMRAGGPTPEAQITLAFRLAAGRRPRPTELQVLLDALAYHRSHYRQDRPAAVRLLGIGEAPRDPRLDPCELAATAAVCSLILNLDEVVTKQ
jgi:mono/diheme cytochrome c family protein